MYKSKVKYPNVEQEYRLELQNIKSVKDDKKEEGLER